jgi:hypothetical protein
VLGGGSERTNESFERQGVASKRFSASSAVPARGLRTCLTGEGCTARQTALCPPPPPPPPQAHDPRAAPVSAPQWRGTPQAPKRGAGPADLEALGN